MGSMLRKDATGEELLRAALLRRFKHLVPAGQGMQIGNLAEAPGEARPTAPFDRG